MCPCYTLHTVKQLSLGLNDYRADCGQEPQTTTILVKVVSNFVGSTTVTAATLMAAASWNVCLNDPTRRSIGEADLCWYAAVHCCNA